MAKKDKSKTRTNLAQTDPYYIPEASRDNRLVLVRSVGPLSGGTRVKLVRTDDKYRNLAVEAHGHKVEVRNEDLRILRFGNRV